MLCVRDIVGDSVGECVAEVVAVFDGVGPVHEGLSKNVKLSVLVGVRYVS